MNLGLSMTEITLFIIARDKSKHLTFPISDAPRFSSRGDAPRLGGGAMEVVDDPKYSGLPFNPSTARCDSTGAMVL
jgi:hypothetical protein